MNVIAALLLVTNFAAVDQEIESRMRSGGIPGAAIVIVHGDHVVHARAFGVTSIESKIPVTTDTLFRLGSTTKMFVAAAALRLADAGKLQLDAPVRALLPDVDPALRRLTLHQLLTHTAGLRDDAPMQGPLDETSMHERVKTWNDGAFFAAPGEIFSYANSDTIRVTLSEHDGALVAGFGGKKLKVSKIGADRYRVAPGSQLETFSIVRDERGRPLFLASAVWALRKQD
jgi:hypothetical protein